MVPSQPTITQLSVKAADSIANCNATGHPSRFISLKSSLVILLLMMSRPYCLNSFLKTITPTIIRAIRMRLPVVEIPAPANPNSGNGPTPYISSQLPNMFTTLPNIITHIATFVLAIPSKNCFAVLNTPTNNIETRLMMK